MTTYMKDVAYLLKAYYANAEETEKIILSCALTAAGADAVGGLIPGLAVPMIVVSCLGAVWAMYGSICAKLNISIKGNVLKILARAALANIVANLGGFLAAYLVATFIPGAGVAASALLTFATVYLAGYIFLQTLLKLAQKSRDPHTFGDIDERDMKDTIKSVKVDQNVAKEAFAAKKKED